MKNIFDTVELKNLSLKNRLLRSATWEGLAEVDGNIKDDTYEIYRELAKGGVGAIITGFTSVATNDFYFGGMMRLSDNKLIPQYKKLVEIIHAEIARQSVSWLSARIIKIIPKSAKIP